MEKIFTVVMNAQMLIAAVGGIVTMLGVDLSDEIQIVLLWTVLLAIYRERYYPNA